MAWLRRPAQVSAACRQSSSPETAAAQTEPLRPPVRHILLVRNVSNNYYSYFNDIYKLYKNEFVR